MGPGKPVKSRNSRAQRTWQKRRHGNRGITVYPLRPLQHSPSRALPRNFVSREIRDTPQTIAPKIPRSNITLGTRDQQFIRLSAEWIKATESTSNTNAGVQTYRKHSRSPEARNRFNFNLHCTHTLIHSGATDEDTDLG